MSRLSFAPPQDRAAGLDALPASERGPLHGVPISVKECISQEGFDATLGLAKYLDKPEDTTAPVLQTLIDLGAVPFCRTNVPQTLIRWVFGMSTPVDLSTPMCIGVQSSMVYLKRVLCSFGSESGARDIIHAEVEATIKYCVILARRLNTAGKKMPGR